MENKNIIIILLVIIVILTAVLGVILLNQTNAKEPTKVKITSDNEQYEGGEVSIQLTDLNKTALSKENVNITITDNKGKVVVNDTVQTNSKGKAQLDLDLKKGEYTINVTYAGNENYTGSNTTQKLTIKEEIKETVSEESYSSSSSSSDSGGWTETSPGGDTGSKIVVYHDGKGHKYVSRYSADGSVYEDGIAYDENEGITS